jgi:predicted nucleic acid-binding protein
VPSYFLDSSAIVKRYHRERGTPWVQRLCEPRTHPPLYLSSLAEVEVVAALRRTGRTQGLHASFVDTMVARFERHIALSVPTSISPVYRLVPLAPTVLTLAAALCNRYWAMQPHPLRSLDAIQLACALAAAADVSDELILVTADARLAAIAPLEGLRVINPSYPPPGSPA